MLLLRDNTNFTFQLRVYQMCNKMFSWNSSAKVVTRGMFKSPDPLSTFFEMNNKLLTFNCGSRLEKLEPLLRSFFFQLRNQDGQRWFRILKRDIVENSVLLRLTILKYYYIIYRNQYILKNAFRLYIKFF